MGFGFLNLRDIGLELLHLVRLSILMILLGVHHVLLADLKCIDLQVLKLVHNVDQVFLIHVVVELSLEVERWSIHVQTLCLSFLKLLNENLVETDNGSILVDALNLNGVTQILYQVL